MFKKKFGVKRECFWKNFRDFINIEKIQLLPIYQKMKKNIHIIQILQKLKIQNLIIMMIMSEFLVAFLDKIKN